MKTKTWIVGSGLDAAERQSFIQEAADFLKGGKLVAFPTETVYGLGADARSTEAVEGIFRAKGRPSDNPLIVHIAEKSQLHDLVDHIDETSCRLMDACWPGPLTLVLPAKPGAVSPRVTAGLATVAVRMPAHPLALALIRAAGCPVAAPSANRSGRPSPTEARHVLDDLDGLIDGIVDGGPTGVGVESTVVEVAADGRVHVLRPGGVSAERLAQLLPGAVISAHGEEAAAAYGAVIGADGATATGKAPTAVAAGAGESAAGAAMEGAEAGVNASDAAVKAAEAGARIAPGAAAMKAAEAAEKPAGAEGDAYAGAATQDSHAAQTSLMQAAAQPMTQAPKSPGMKYAHYAPRGRLTLVRGVEPDRVAARIRRELEEARNRGEATGVLTFVERAHLYEADLVVPCGGLNDPESVARGLYAALRRFDDAGATFILAEMPEEKGIGAAVVNRLRKAAADRVLDV